MKTSMTPQDVAIKDFHCSEHGAVKPLVTPKCPLCQPTSIDEVMEELDENLFADDTGWLKLTSPTCNCYLQDEEMMEWLRTKLTTLVEQARGAKVEFPEHEASMHITHNQHKAYYQSIESYIAEEHLQIESDDWATPTSRERCIANDDIWELQWYPNTPIGFCKIYGATFEEVLTAARTISSDKK